MNQVPDENDLIYTTYGVDVLGLLQALYEKIFGGDWEAFLDLLGMLWNIYSIIAILLSLLFFAGFIYAKIRTAQLYEIEQESLREAEARWAAKFGQKRTGNPRWEGIQQKVSDSNPESWRLAIIEADVLLDETLKNAGYVGQTLGERLKGANPNSFTTLQDAWEAHKVRNEIAHVGSDFVLTKKTAHDTIVRYERVFHEFKVI